MGVWGCGGVLRGVAFSGYWVGLHGLEGPPSPSPNPSAIESYMNPFQGKCRLVASPKSDSLCLYPQCVQAGWATSPALPCGPKAGGQC